MLENKEYSSTNLINDVYQDGGIGHWDVGFNDGSWSDAGGGLESHRLPFHRNLETRPASFRKGCVFVSILSSMGAIPTHSPSAHRPWS